MTFQTEPRTHKSVHGIADVGRSGLIRRCKRPLDGMQLGRLNIQCSICKPVTGEQPPAKASPPSPHPACLGSFADSRSGQAGATGGPVDLVSWRAIVTKRVAFGEI